MNYAMVLSIGVVTRTPKIERELQQNHNETHNAIEHKKRPGPLSKSAGRSFSRRRRKSPTVEVTVRLDLHSVGTAGFEPATP